MLDGLFKIDKSKAGVASAVLGRSFEDDPLWRYIIPDPVRRHELLPRILLLRVRMGVRYGEVYSVTPALEGVAVWLPSEKTDTTAWQTIRFGGIRLLFSIKNNELKRLVDVGRFVEKLRDKDLPRHYYHLSPLGIEPRYQGQGYASRLLRPMLARLDIDHVPCYLETNRERNVSIYRHFGFKILREAPIHETGVTYWSMLR